MALPLAKLTILVGAGIAGSVLAAKDGRVSTVSDFVSGAFKLVWKQLRDDSPTQSVKKPPNDALLAQVNSLRQELQLLASNRPVTIVTAGGNGSSKYGVVIVIVVVGYGYVWWKGWRLPDMMFATKRSLTDACNSVSKQLENVYSSIAATKLALSKRIDRVDSSMDNVSKLTAATKDQVTELRGQAEIIGLDVNSVHHAVKTLEKKISRIEVLQDATNSGVKKLCDIALTMENGGTNERIQALPPGSSRATLELLPSTPSPKIESSSASGLFLGPSSPSGSSESHKVQRSLQTVVSASGLKDINGISEVAQALGTPEVSNKTRPAEDAVNGSSSSGFFGMKLPAMNASFLTRRHSAANSFKLSNNGL